MKTFSREEIIGISKKFNFGQWTAYVRIFDNQEKAEKWLFTEEYDFRERGLFENEYKAIRFYGEGGKKAINEARLEIHQMKEGKLK